MTEGIFTELNFEKNVVTPEESGNDKDFYYYSLDIGDICIISNADDEAEKNGWEAYIFDSGLDECNSRKEGAGAGPVWHLQGISKRCLVLDPRLPSHRELLS